MARKLSDEQLEVMRELLDSGMWGSDVATRIGCSDRAVYERRQRWNMGLERAAPKKSRLPTATKYWHGHHFDHDLKCVHCGLIHPGSKELWNASNWTPCEECPEPERIQPRSKIEQAPKEIETRTYCKRGHEFTPDNIYVPPTGRGRRQCRRCRIERDRMRNVRLAEEREKRG